MDEAVSRSSRFCPHPDCAKKVPVESEDAVWTQFKCQSCDGVGWFCPFCAHVARGSDARRAITSHLKLHHSIELKTFIREENVDPAFYRFLPPCQCGSTVCKGVWPPELIKDKNERKKVPPGFIATGN